MSIKTFFKLFFQTLTNDQFGDLGIGVPCPVPVLEGLHHIEPDGLVAALLHDGGRHALVKAPEPWKNSIFYSYIHIFYSYLIFMTVADTPWYRPRNPEKKAPHLVCLSAFNTNYTDNFLLLIHSFIR